MRKDRFFVASSFDFHSFAMLYRIINEPIANLICVFAAERLITCINHLKQVVASKIVPNSAAECAESAKNIDKMVKHATSTYLRASCYYTIFANIDKDNSFREIERRSSKLKDISRDKFEKRLHIVRIICCLTTKTLSNYCRSRVLVSLEELKIDRLLDLYFYSNSFLLSSSYFFSERRIVSNGLPIFPRNFLNYLVMAGNIFVFFCN